MRKKVFISVGLLLFGLTAVWHFALVPRLTERIPPDWNWEASYIGYQTNADPQTGILPEKDLTTKYTHAITTVPNSSQPGSVEINDSYIIHDISTGQVVFAFNYRARVDPRNGQDLREEYRGDSIVFPRNVERKTYKLRFSYLKGILVAFQREEEIGGLNTYLFTYRGRGEYTDAYLGTAEFPGLKIPPGEEIKCADDQFIYKVWVEPLTGEMVRIEEGCPSKDYLYEIATGKQLEVVDRWGGETAGDDVLRHVEAASRARSKILWQTRYVPAGLLAAGLCCFALTILPRQGTRNKDA